MFFIRGRNNAGASNEKRSIYHRFFSSELMDRKRTETALKAGEDRAILLGLGMVICSIMMYFVIGVALVRSFADSVWTEETVCTVLNSSLTLEVNCSYSCGPECWRSSTYPCLQVYVSLQATGRIALLSHNEETQDISAQCFYVPKCQKDQAATHILLSNVSERLKAGQQVPCFYDPLERHSGALLTRLHSRGSVLRSLFWPSCTLLGGMLIILLVKLTQFLSALCEQVTREHK